MSDRAGPERLAGPLPFRGRIVAGILWTMPDRLRAPVRPIGHSPEYARNATASKREGARKPQGSSPIGHVSLSNRPQCGDTCPIRLWALGGNVTTNPRADLK